MRGRIEVFFLMDSRCWKIDGRNCCRRWGYRWKRIKMFLGKEGVVNVFFIGIGNI